MNYYISCFRDKFCCFEGRARRAEFWQFSLINALVQGLLQGIYTTAVFISPLFGAIIMLVYVAYIFAQILPDIGVQIRRMHDIGRSGWALCWGLVPLVGVFVVLYFMCKDSQRGRNQYGDSEKYPEANNILDELVS